MKSSVHRMYIKLKTIKSVIKLVVPPFTVTKIHKKDRTRMNAVPDLSDYRIV